MEKEKLDNMPEHLAIIPDGNRRWAKERGLEPWDGHEFGAQNTEKLIKYAMKKGLQCLTFGVRFGQSEKAPTSRKKSSSGYL
jgi:undecaprenyl diphosphate synthase